MAGTFYAAVEGDPLTSGGHVYSEKNVGTIQSADGKHRRMVFIGDPAYCDTCKTTGHVIGGAPTDHRMRDFCNGGRLQAVGGDWVSCKCDPPPRIVATYGTRWGINDTGGSRNAKTASSQKSIASAAAYDACVVLYSERTGEPLSRVHYRFLNGSNVVAEGVTDAQGRTERVSSRSAETFQLQVKGI